MCGSVSKGEMDNYRFRRVRVEFGIFGRVGRFVGVIGYNVVLLLDLTLDLVRY